MKIKVKENSKTGCGKPYQNDQAIASLYNLDIEGLSGGAKLNERTEAIEYIEFEVEPGSKYMNLKLRGPWKFEFSEASFTTDRSRYYNYCRSYECSQLRFHYGATVRELPEPVCCFFSPRLLFPTPIALTSR